SLCKIKQLKEMADRAGADIDIEVDGGIHTSNVADVIEAGANVIVAGTAVFRGNIKENIAEFKNKFSAFPM
ncbi:MAG TPA: ribulose-phosphate 3-epimerase, partial [Lachnospiraceae bacterium]|nr:ribulose-phosphate 3-epimerase [Lachnospiraceae bacterium]